MRSDKKRIPQTPWLRKQGPEFDLSGTLESYEIDELTSQEVETLLGKTRPTEKQQSTKKPGKRTP